MIIAVRGLTIYFHRNHYFHYLFFSKINHLFNPAIPAEHKLLFAHAAVSGDIEDHEEVTDELSIHPDHNCYQILIRRIHFESLLLVWFSFLVSEESFTDCCKLIDVDRIISVNEKRIFWMFSFHLFLYLLVLIKSCKTSIHYLVSCCFSLLLGLQQITSFYQTDNLNWRRLEVRVLGECDRLAVTVRNSLCKTDYSNILIKIIYLI